MFIEDSYAVFKKLRIMFQKTLILQRAKAGAFSENTKFKIQKQNFERISFRRITFTISFQYHMKVSTLMKITI